MLYIILTILISVLLLIIFKAFQKYEVNSLVAIVINYITAGITGILFLDNASSVSDIRQAEWLHICLPLGLLFISVFYLISQTAQRISISSASVANKMSVIMPVLFSIFLLHQQPSVVKVLGMVLAMLALYLSTFSTEKRSVNRNLFWLPVLVFIGSGLIDIAINFTNTFYISTKDESALFTISTFLSAFTMGLIVLIFLVFVKRSLSVKEIVKPKNIIGGIILGIPNYFSIFFIFKSLDARILQSSQLFPVLNLSNVALAALLGWLIYKEKLSFVNILGIVLAIVSILMISL